MAETASRLDRSGKRLAMVGVSGALLLWLAAYFWLPVPNEAGDPHARLAYAVGWIAVAMLFGLTMAVEAVAHERLQTDAFDPLSGHETRRLQVNQRYLQNTLEQSVLFAAGLIGLALIGTGEGTIRAITACAIVWIVTRYLFWIGYHQVAKLRVMGIAGLAQSMLVLIWVVASFGDRHWGLIGWVLPVLTVLAIEAVLVLNTREASGPKS